MSHEPVFGIPPDLVRGPSADVLPLAGEANWGMEVFGVNALRDAGHDGDGIKLGVVDTGIDRGHPLLTNVIEAYDFTGDGPGDRNGHGTHVSGTSGGTRNGAITVATGAQLIHAKGLSDSGSGSMTWLLNAMRKCVDRGCEVLSCSWGGGGLDAATERFLKELDDAGIWAVFAGGNSGPNTPDTDAPGVSLHVPNVAALNRDLTPASFSSAGAKIDTSGPGVGIWSTKPGGGFQQMSGTSMATPFVAGLLACYRGALKKLGLPIPKVAELRELLFTRSTDTHTPGDDRRTGPGWITPLLLSINLNPDPPLPEGGPLKP